MHEPSRAHADGSLQVGYKGHALFRHPGHDGQNGLPGRRVEPFQIRGIDHSQFMVSHNRRDVAGYDLLHDRFGFRAVADHIAETDDCIDPVFFDVIENFVQGLHVAMDIGDDGYSHGCCIASYRERFKISVCPFYAYVKYHITFQYHIISSLPKKM